jgi:hypothetical protein
LGQPGTIAQRRYRLNIEEMMSSGLAGNLNPENARSFILEAGGALGFPRIFFEC